MKCVTQIPKNVANLQASHVYFKKQTMNCQCIDLASFASGRKQTSHGVVLDNRFSVVQDDLTSFKSGFRVFGLRACDV